MKSHGEVEVWVQQQMRRLADREQLTLYWLSREGQLQRLVGPWAKRQELLNTVSELTAPYLPKIEAYRGGHRVTI